MNVPFPFGLPFPTAAYLTLYVATLAMHVVFMNYMLAGCACIAVSESARWAARRPGPEAYAVSILRDWMPAALSAAITAGVAPLLFVQMLYRESFYTANLLLLHRWMAILPVLIVAFYLMYIQKAKPVGAWPAWARMAVSVATLLLVCFVGYSWTENHLLSSRRTLWPDFYATGRMIYFEDQLVPRLAMWLFGAIPTLCCLLAWQMRQSAADPSVIAADLRRVSVLALFGLAFTVGCGAWYAIVAGPEVRAATGTWFAAPYLLLAIVGLGIQSSVWFVTWRHATLSARATTVLFAAVCVTILSMCVVREAIRLSTLDNLEVIFERQAQSARSGGSLAFLLFAILNVGVIAWCVRSALRGKPNGVV